MASGHSPSSTVRAGGEPIRVRVDETEGCLVKNASSAKKRKRYLEVFFTTVLRLGSEQILKEYRGRWSVEMCWSVEILIREAKESFGLGKDRCRNAQKIAGINNFRLLIGAAEVLYRAEVS